MAAARFVPDEGAVIDRTIEILRQLSELSIGKLREIAADVSVDKAVELTETLVALDSTQPCSPFLRCLVIELMFTSGRLPECVAVAAELRHDDVPAEVAESAAVAQIIATGVVDPTAGAAEAETLLREPGRARPVELAAAAAVLADFCWDTGRLDDGLAWAGRATSHAERLPSPFWRMYLRLGLASKLADAGSLGEAEALCRQVNNEVRRIPCAGISLALAAVRTRILIHRGKWTMAYRNARRAGLLPVRPDGEQMFAPHLLACLAVAEVYAGDVAAARGHLDDARPILASLTARGGAVRTQWTIVYQWAEIMVREAVHGPVAALELIEETYGGDDARLTALFGQVTGSPAWIVRIGAQCARDDLSRRVVRVAEELGRANPGLPQLAMAAEHARSLLDGDVAGLAEAASKQTHRWARTCAAADLVAMVQRASGNEEQPAELAGLSERERQIAELVVEGMTNRQIASRISCSVHTVNFHLRNIFRKLGIRSRIEIAHYVPKRPDA